MSNTPTISIIIPAYNGESVILETLDSIFNQTFQDFEIIVVNDESKDNTLGVLATVQDPRLKVITIKNQGVCGARNVGIQAAKGEYLAFLDHDDLWTKDKLSDQLEALRSNPKAGVAYSWTQPFYTGSSKELAYERCYFQGQVYDELLKGNFTAQGSNVMATRAAVESIGGYDEHIPFMGDWDFCLRLAANWEFAVVPKPQILYRLSTSSMSSNVENMENQYLTMLKRAYPLSRLPYAPLVSNHYILLISICLSRTNTRQDAFNLLKFFKKSFVSHPWSFVRNSLALRNFVKTCKILIAPPVLQTA